MSKGQSLKQFLFHKKDFGKIVRRGLLLLAGTAIFLIAGWFVATLLLGLGGHSVRPTGEKAEKTDKRIGAASGEGSLPPVVETLVSTKDGAEMIFIPPGEFSMGTDGGYANEKPEHTIFVDGFYIYVYEVTVSQYRVFLQDSQGKGHEPDEPYGEYMPPDYFTNPKYDDYPVVNVSWEDADAYCRWADKRLPKEAEWEKAARSTDKRIYPWGDAWDEKRANWDDEENSFRTDGYRFTAPVGSFPQGISPFGVHDLAGNVWEWVDDWYQPYDGNPTKDVDYGNTYRIIRGGSWLRYPLGLTTTSRDTSAPGLRFDSIGFRCACDRR
jgi:formylglycine-generating enzyme required for sulfatase activity